MDARRFPNDPNTARPSADQVRRALRLPYHFTPSTLVDLVSFNLPLGYVPYAGIDDGKTYKYAGRDVGPDQLNAVQAAIQALMHFGGTTWLKTVYSHVFASIAEQYQQPEWRQAGPQTPSERLSVAILTVIKHMLAMHGPVNFRIPSDFLRALVLFYDSLGNQDPPALDTASFARVWETLVAGLGPMPDVQHLTLNVTDVHDRVDVAAFAAGALGGDALPLYLAVRLRVKHPSGSLHVFALDNWNVISIGGARYCLRAMVRYVDKKEEKKKKKKNKQDEEEDNSEHKEHEGTGEGASAGESPAAATLEQPDPMDVDPAEIRVQASGAGVDAASEWKPKAVGGRYLVLVWNPKSNNGHGQWHTMQGPRVYTGPSAEALDPNHVVELLTYVKTEPATTAAAPSTSNTTTSTTPTTPTTSTTPTTPTTSTTSATATLPAPTSPSQPGPALQSDQHTAALHASPGHDDSHRSQSSSPMIVDEPDPSPNQGTSLATPAPHFASGDGEPAAMSTQPAAAAEAAESGPNPSGDEDEDDAPADPDGDQLAPADLGDVPDADAAAVAPPGDAEGDCPLIPGSNSLDPSTVAPAKVPNARSRGREVETLAALPLSTQRDPWHPLTLPRPKAKATAATSASTNVARYRREQRRAKKQQAAARAKPPSPAPTVAPAPPPSDPIALAKYHIKEARRIEKEKIKCDKAKKLQIAREKARRAVGRVAKGPSKP